MRMASTPSKYRISAMTLLATFESSLLAFDTTAQSQERYSRGCLIVLKDDTYTLGSNRTLACITIESGGTLDTNGHTLTLNGGGLVTIDGTLLLPTAASKLKISDSLTLTGDGEILGESNSATIEIDTNKTLTSNVVVEGSMTILGLGTPATMGKFRNQNHVHANTNGGTLTLNCRTEDDATTNKWQVTAGATLSFMKGTNSLHGKFVVDGTAHFGASVRTCGQLQFNSGASIDVNSTTFKYLTFDLDSTCSNPADSGSGTDCTTDPYVVDSDHLNCM